MLQRRTGFGMFAALFSASPAVAADIHLVCLGAGTANKVRSSTVYVTGSNGNSAWAQAVGTREVPFDDQVNVDIVDAGQSRIRLPRIMLPPLHGGGNGWMKLNDVRINDQEITGSASVNFINHPKVRIDRMTGRISISGKSGDFAGECQAYDPASVPRRF